MEISGFISWHQLLSKLFEWEINFLVVGMLVRVTAQFSFKFMRDVFCNLHSKKQLAIFTLNFLIIRSGVQFYLNATSHLCGFLHLIHLLVKWTISSVFCIYLSHITIQTIPQFRTFVGQGLEMISNLNFHELAIGKCNFKICQLHS